MCAFGYFLFPIFTSDQEPKLVSNSLTYELNLQRLLKPPHDGYWGFRGYRDEILGQLRTNQSLLTNCYLKQWGPSFKEKDTEKQKLRRGDTFFYVSVDIDAKGVNVTAVDALSYEKIKKIVQDDERIEQWIEFRKAAKQNDYSAIGFTIDFNVHYPKHYVYFGVHVEVLVLKSTLDRQLGEWMLMQKSEKAPAPPWEYEIADALSDSLNRHKIIWANSDQPQRPKTPSPSPHPKHRRSSSGPNSNPLPHSCSLSPNHPHPHSTNVRSASQPGHTKSAPTLEKLPPRSSSTPARHSERTHPSSGQASGFPTDRRSPKPMTRSRKAPSPYRSEEYRHPSRSYRRHDSSSHRHHRPQRPSSRHGKGFPTPYHSQEKLLETEYLYSSSSQDHLRPGNHPGRKVLQRKPTHGCGCVIC